MLRARTGAVGRCPSSSRGPGLAALVHSIAFEEAARTLTVEVGVVSPRVVVELVLPCGTGEPPRVARVLGASEALARAASAEVEAGVDRTLVELVVAVVGVLQAAVAGPHAGLSDSDRLAYVEAERAGDARAVHTHVALFAAALASPRRGSVLVPCPEHALRSDGDVDFAALQRAIDALGPRMEALQGPLAALPAPTLSVLHWILHSGRGLQLRTRDGVGVASAAGGAPGKHLRVELGRAPGSAEFLSLAKEHGKVTVYHGSAIENMYSIVRNGLKNMSGSNLMRTGAVFGDGIYATGDLSVAVGFMVEGPMAGGKYGAVAECEVVLHPDVLAARKAIDPKEGAASYYVIANERHIAVKALLLYELSGTAAPAGSKADRAAGPAVQQPRPARRISVVWIVIGLYALGILALGVSQSRWWKVLKNKLAKG